MFSFFFHFYYGGTLSSVMEDFPSWMCSLWFFLCLHPRWVMIHMLVGDGRRSRGACWPVREMWQRLVCRDKPESVACSSQSLRGLAETPTGSCLPSLSFISLSFALSIFHVPSVSRSLPHFATSPLFSFIFPLFMSTSSLLSAVPSFLTRAHSLGSSRKSSSSRARFVAAHCLRQYLT